MTQSSVSAHAGRLARVLGWLLAASYLAHSWVTIVKARTDRALPLRDELRGWHFLVGAVLFALAAWRLWVWWRQERSERPGRGLPPGLWYWGRTVALVTWLILLVAPVLGLGWGWAEGMRLHLGPIPLPPLIGENRAVWQFSGYFHSSAGFMITLLSLGMLLAAGWGKLVHGRGLFALLPPGHAAFVLISVGSTVYALATFGGPEPGVPALAVFAGALGAVWLLGRVIHGAPPAEPPVPVQVPRRGGPTHFPPRLVPPPLKDREMATTPSPGTFARLMAPLAALALLTVGALGPYQQFRVTPWPRGEVVQAEDQRVWHAEVRAQVQVLPETEFERGVREELYKWCTFCHTVERGDRRFKVGPNLHAIFGQQAGTVPGFHYSESLARAGREGLVWNDETIAAYIADPQRFIPGTSMIVSSGPIPDPAVQAAIVNILKRDTMPAEALEWLEGGAQSSGD
jgi:cytochrome c2/cytochrome b561